MSDIRKLSAQDERVETGAVQFGDDWPGVFIRGDNAFYYCGALRAYIKAKPVEGDEWAAALGVQGLAHVLASCDLTGLSQQEAAPPPAMGPWQAAVDEALVSHCLDCTGPDTNPREAVARLIAWATQMALDPSISEQAQALIDRGRAEALKG